jgi:hypothetical protein
MFFAFWLSATGLDLLQLGSCALNFLDDFLNRGRPQLPILRKVI